MAKTIRKYWGPLRGRATLNYNWPAIDDDSVVLVTVSEYDDRGARFIGAATIGVSNIAPHGPPFDPNHGVTFVVHVDWGSPLNVVTDITVLDKPVEIQAYEPPSPPNIGLRMQYQETTQWCWMAVSASVSRFYNPASTWTQCQIMTVVGHTINGFPANTSACPNAAAFAANPGLAAVLADPYEKAAEFALEGAAALGIDPRYVKSGGVSDGLKVTGNYASTQWNLSLDQIAAEVNAGRPVIASITWFSGGSHFVAIAGVQGDSMLILDPANGTSVVRAGAFPGSYFGGAKQDEYTFTKHA